MQAQLSKEPVKMKPRKPIYLHDIELVCSPQFEAQFESFLREKVSLENAG